MKLDNLLGKILGTSKSHFDEVQIDKEVTDEIMNIAKESYPNEFMALLEGKISDKILKITGLIFLPVDTSQEGAVMQVFMQPLTTNSVGSVHSHPGFNASPSDADLTFFSKKGLFHMIIAEPYNMESIRAYDSYGNIVDFKTI
ncbi:MAG: Mov34/MPN/PAD-1 family protein [Methanobacterium sp.]|uniref:Mov34/MPN/PAD-1 family protein n=1 Tax=Methanobacterium sp. TaxID=2164 RepID=UPI003D656EF8|nr:Mov34/MPN/PAD-1 family protein [Methanobacterium sp.]